MRQKVRAKFTYVYISDFTDVKELIDELQTKSALAASDGFSDLRVEKHDGYDGVEWYISGLRLETDAEMAIRMRQEEQTEKYQREQYLALKKKFEK